MEYREQARAWIAEDPDPDTRDELQRLLDLGDEPGLADRFGERLTFGTAGLRGALGAGPNRMNRAMVRRVTAGLADRLNQAAGPVGARGVVVGRDARHGSDAFAADAAAVLAGAGIGVWKFPDVVPTPLVAYAVRYLEAAAGVQITASHNPPGDNGYKVFMSGGRQILPPLDEEISEAIDEIGALSHVPLARPDSDLIWRIPSDTVEHYLQDVLGVVSDDASRELRIVYTPLHGVAGGIVGAVLRRAGFADVHVVPEQADPDPDFPTVRFPNPEEPGTMDLALDLARRTGADLVLANDPDGDRIAAAIPDGAGGWRLLTGDEIGVLLAEDLLSRYPDGAPRPVVATTVVSSALLRRVAAHHGARYAETLTGFKWMAQVAVDAEAAGERMVLAYEQALGASVGDIVRDKDGISAALLLADIAARARVLGRSVGDLLDDLARTHGLHVTDGRSVRLEEDDHGVVQRALDRLRAVPPGVLAGAPVTAIADHESGVVRHRDGGLEQIDLPSTPLLRFTCDDGTRGMVRPSGTEAKLKFYAEVRYDVSNEAPLEPSREQARQRAARVLDDLVAAALGEAPL